MDESHTFYKKIPPTFFGSKKPKSAEAVSYALVIKYVGEVYSG